MAYAVGMADIEQELLAAMHALVNKCRALVQQHDALVREYDRLKYEFLKSRQHRKKEPPSHAGDDDGS